MVDDAGVVCAFCEFAPDLVLEFLSAARVLGVVVVVGVVELIEHVVEFVVRVGAGAVAVAVAVALVVCEEGGGGGEGPGSADVVGVVVLDGVVEVAGRVAGNVARGGGGGGEGVCGVEVLGERDELDGERGCLARDVDDAADGAVRCVLCVEALALCRDGGRGRGGGRGGGRPGGEGEAHAHMCRGGAERGWHEAARLGVARVLADAIGRL